MEDSLCGSTRVDTVGTRESNAKGGPNTVTTSRAWQQEAWARYDEVGEVRYAAGFIGACLSRCTLTIGIPDSKGNIGPVFDEDGEPLKDENGQVLSGLERAKEALELIRMLRNDVAGQSQLLRSMGENLTVPANSIWWALRSRFQHTRHALRCSLQAGSASPGSHHSGAVPRQPPLS